MIWKKDRLKPTQPYFVFDTDDFYQEVYLQQGISHFYTFKMREDSRLRIVPDGCIDLFFVFRDGKMEGYACGTRLEYSLDDITGKNEVFGVRFMPGMQPEFLNVNMRELLGVRIPLTDVLRGSQDWLSLLAQEQDFYQRIRVFIEHFTKAENKREKPYGKKAILLAVKQIVYDTDGKARVSEIAEKTGYSERYINRIFLEEMGFSPKIFCGIIRFQRALEFLNYGAPDKMTDAAVALGYYDQPQFIRSFTHYAGMTPKKYLTLVQEKQYSGRVHEIKS